MTERPRIFLAKHYPMMLDTKAEFRLDGGSVTVEVKLGKYGYETVLGMPDGLINTRGLRVELVPDGIGRNKLVHVNVSVML